MKPNFKIIKISSEKMRKFYEEHPEEDFGWKKEELGLLSKNANWWLVYAGKIWVGFAKLNVVDDGIEGYLGPTFIRPEYRGNGLQVRLIRVRIAYAKKIMVPLLTTLVPADRIQSINNLMCCGFKLKKFQSDQQQYLLTKRI